MGSWVHFFCFLGRIEETTICFRDCLAFSNVKTNWNILFWQFQIKLGDFLWFWLISKHTCLYFQLDLVCSSKEYMIWAGVIFLDLSLNQALEYYRYFVQAKHLEAPFLLCCLNFVCHFDKNFFETGLLQKVSSLWLCSWQVSIGRELVPPRNTDKETDESWDIFIVWKINSGL